MSDEPSAKRQRVDGSSSASLAAPAPPVLDAVRVAEVQAKIWAMKPELVQARAAAFVACDTSGQFSRMMERWAADDKAKARAQTISFARYAQKVDYVFNDKYAHLRDSEQFDASGDVQTAVEHMLDDIVARTREHSHYATKKSAVETMRSIFETMLDAGGVIGKEVRNDCYDWDAKFLKVMGTFTGDELDQLANEDEGAWVDKFRALVKNAKGYCVLEKLQQSLDDLEAYQGDDDDDEDEDEDEDDEDNEE